MGGENKMAMQHCSNELGTFDYDDDMFALKFDENKLSYLSYIGHETNGANIAIPSGIKDTRLMFAHSNIVSQPDIPRGVESADGMFFDCADLSKAGSLPDTLRNADSMYSYCVNIETAPYMPNNVESANFMYDGCDKITMAPNLSSKLQFADGMFANCKSLKSIPDFPDGLISADSVCLNCESLKEPPSIPDSVRNLTCGFAGCENLQTQPVIKNEIESENIIEGCHWVDQDDNFEELEMKNDISISNSYDFKNRYQNSYTKQQPVVSKETLKKAIESMSFTDCESIQFDLNDI